MTNAELLDLLREAREDVDAMGNGDLCRAIDRALAIHDAALAEGCPDCGHQYGQQEYCQGDGHAEPPDSAQRAVESEAVEWVEYSDGDLMAYPGDGNILSVRKREDGRWQWNTEIDREDGGFCATVDEAKAAALSAARGLK